MSYPEPKYPHNKKNPSSMHGTSTKSKVKKDYFDSAVIVFLAIMIGALITYLLITNAPG